MKVIGVDFVFSWVPCIQIMERTGTETRWNASDKSSAGKRRHCSWVLTREGPKSRQPGKPLQWMINETYLWTGTKWKDNGQLPDQGYGALTMRPSRHLFSSCTKCERNLDCCYYLPVKCCEAHKATTVSRNNVQRLVLLSFSFRKLIERSWKWS